MTTSFFDTWDVQRIGKLRHGRPKTRNLFFTSRKHDRCDTCRVMQTIHISSKHFCCCFHPFLLFLFSYGNINNTNVFIQDPREQGGCYGCRRPVSQNVSDTALFLSGYSESVPSSALSRSSSQWAVSAPLASNNM